MLCKCILFSSFRRASSHCESVKKELDIGIQVIWLIGLWSEVQIEEARLNSRMKRKNSSLCSENACRAIEDGQYRRAIQFFTSCGVAQVCDDVKLKC